MTNTIHAQGLTKRYGDFAAVDAVDFTVQQGEVVGFVGLNGAGKSTTIHMLLGFIRPTAGTVQVLDRVILPENAHKVHARIGFASGDMELLPHLTGKQYIAFLERSYGVGDKRSLELMTMFQPDLSKKIGDLSRGNRQKIALIAAFLHSPKLVVLDEPSSGLDPLMQQTFLDLIRQEEARGTTVFMSSHYLNEVADVCSRVLLMRKGKLVKDIPAHQLKSISGKAVRIVSEHKIRPPVGAEDVLRDGHELSFVYKGMVSQLQRWLMQQPILTDVTIMDHDVESAFSSLYNDEKGVK